MTAPERGVVRSGAELVNLEHHRWIVPGDLVAPLAVFVHGFAAHGRYLEQLARYVGAQDFVAAMFNHDSYRGIDQAALELEFLLDGLEDTVCRHGYVLVGHSMGGLVARYFAEYARSPCRSGLIGIATLGTPHRGTLARRLVHPLLDWGDAVTVPNPFARSVACPASRQLTDADPEGLIAQLNRRTEANSDLPPMLSLSGGLPYLEFGAGGGGFAGALRNLVLQRLIGQRPNDGLVPESSSNIAQALKGSEHRTHRQDYPAYPRTNHSYLSQSQQVGRLLRQWLKQIAIDRAPTSNSRSQAG